MEDIKWIEQCIQEAEEKGDNEMLEYFYNMLDSYTE